MNLDLESFRRRLATEPAETVREDLQRAVLDRRDARGDHAAWAELCEQAGLMAMAFHELQLAMRDNRDDAAATFRLAQHYRERGDTTRAVAMLERLVASEPARDSYLSLYLEILVDDGAQPRAEQALARAVQAGLAPAAAAQLRRLLRPPTERDAESAARQDQDVAGIVPTDADCVRFHTLFSGREGVYARQWAKRGGEGGYSPVHEPFTPAIVRNHLLGTYTVGVYPVRLDGTATFFAVDLDINKTALQRAAGDHPFADSLRQTLRREGPRLLGVLRELGFSVLFENSGYKGRHYWVFLAQPETTATLHLLGRLLVRWQAPLLPADLHMEFFPKQVRLTGKGLGNLIKVPLGIHRRTGYRSTILDDAGNPEADPFAVLRGMTPTPRSVLHAALERLRGLAADTAECEEVDTGVATGVEQAKPPVAPPATLPPRVLSWTEADFETDARVRHMLRECAVLAELKRMVDEYRQLSHEEQLVLIHTIGHVESGPQCVNYLLGKCMDVGPEKLMKSRLKGSPVSCPSIRKKIPHVTRRVSCNCPFEYAKDRYPTPVLHLLTLADTAPPPAPSPTAAALLDVAQRFAVLDCRRKEIEREWESLHKSFVEALRAEPDQQVACPGGHYRLVQVEGVEELTWQPDAAKEP